MRDETFTVGHIHCGGCERTIRTLLGDIDGVEQVHPDHRTNTVAVRFDEARIDRESLGAQLADIGYAPKEA
jgi:copper chaperone CopZ